MSKNDEELRRQILAIGLNHKSTNAYGQRFIAYGECVEDLQTLIAAREAEARVDELQKIPAALDALENQLGITEIVRLMKEGKSAWDTYLPGRLAQLNQDTKEPEAKK